MRTLLLIILTGLSAAWSSDDVVDAQAAAGPVCALELAGTWKPESGVEANPIFLSFSTGGWVSLLESDGEGRAADFAIMAQAQYRLVLAPSPRVEFHAQRGNDLLPPGASAWEILEYGDDRFTAAERDSDRRTSWIRVQTHRYFVTLAAEAGGPALAMWTKLDGRRTDVEGLTLRGRADDRGAAAAFLAPLRPETARVFAVEGRNESRVMVRLELTEADYHRTRRVLDDWMQRLQDQRLPREDPARLMTRFLHETLATAGQCGSPLDLRGVAGQPPLDVIRLVRAANDSRHVRDDRFPFAWAPPPAK